MEITCNWISTLRRWTSWHRNSASELDAGLPYTLSDREVYAEYQEDTQERIAIEIRENDEEVKPSAKRDKRNSVENLADKPILRQFSKT
ncbi:hypothetical protein CHS0354_028085 [Potamilus streckersoni]|uniref:Uncharacterized protein n=1 Tax=Potamilus streckersoni TaxID=2493646 RepID=A0AAE0WDI5_9BIVA|nr:hypothetical protein CHS0354_028085 [Potamilus streckersoni]